MTAFPEYLNAVKARCERAKETCAFFESWTDNHLLESACRIMYEALKNGAQETEDYQDQCDNQWHAGWYGGFLDDDDPSSCPRCGNGAYGGQIRKTRPTRGATKCKAALAAVDALAKEPT